MKQYLNLLRFIKETGTNKSDRTNTGTKSIFGYQMRFDLAEGFPLMTTKAIHLPSVIYELLWFLQGSTNIGYLTDNDVRIWNEWADEHGDLGRIYGAQWRSWRSAEKIELGHSQRPESHRSWRGINGEEIDQITTVINQIKNHPNSRRLIVSAWNVGELEKMALPPCHLLFQFYVVNNKLSCQLYQRSADVFLGVPFNIASYSLLTSMVAQQCDLEVGEFIWCGGDVHIYHNHFDQVNTQLARTPKTLPTLKIKRKPKDIFSYQYEDFEFINYHPDPAIKAAVAV